MGALPPSCAHSPRVCLPASYPTPYDLVAPELLGFHDFQTHVASRTHHGLHRRVQICGVEIDKLNLGDFLYLLLRNFSDFVAVRLSGALHNARRAQQKNRSRRRLQNESKRAVGVNGDQHRKNHSVRFLRRFGVELLAKIHNVQAMRTERRANRRRRRSLASRKLQLDRRLNLLSYVLASKFPMDAPSFSPGATPQQKPAIPTSPRWRNPTPPASTAQKS